MTRGFMKKRLKKQLIGWLCIALLLTGCGIFDDDWWEEDYDHDNAYGQNEEDSSFYNHDTIETEAGDGTATVLVYLMGSDLETQNGEATADIQEMCAASLSENVNVIIQTGGALSWTYPGISSDTIGRFRIENGKLELLETKKKESMVKASTLTDFLKWGAENYPADTMCVVLWDHGAGTVGGYGLDEFYPNDTLSLSDLEKAFYNAGVHFNFIGFDACLMGTVENANSLSPYADYLIASEETEPGTGWYYTDWLSLLSRNPSGDVTVLGRRIIDDYIDGPDASFFDMTTMSMIDLSKIPDVYHKLNIYYSSEMEALNNGGYSDVSYGRSRATAFGDGEYDQIDIISYLSYMDSDEARELSSSVESAVVYSKASFQGANGLAMYFPYDELGFYEDIYGSYYEEDDYGDDFFSDFLSMLINGEYDEESYYSDYGSDCEDGYGYGYYDYYDYYDSYYEDEYDYGDCDSWSMDFMEGCVRSGKFKEYKTASWYQPDKKDESAGGYFLLKDGELGLEESEEGYVLPISDEQWNRIANISMSVMLKDEDGFIDLGQDDIYEFDEDGNLIIDYDYYWVALNGIIVPYYYTDSENYEDGTWYSYGYVPAVLTKKGSSEETDIDIMLYFDETHEEGYVTGYRYYSEEDTLMYPRYLRSFEKGDQLRFVCDYYKDNGEFDASYYLEDTLTVDGEITVSYEAVEEYTTWVYFTIKDLYQNEYYTETVEFSFE